MKTCKNRHVRGDWSDRPGDAHRRTETIRRGLTVTLADQYRYSYPRGKGHGASACCEHVRSIIRVTGAPGARASYAAYLELADALAEMGL